MITLSMNAGFFNGTPVFVLLGRTGSGKSKAGKAVFKKLGLPFLSMGVLARAEIAKSTDLGKYFEKLFIEKKQIPDELVVELIEKSLHLNPQKFKRGFLLDNFPNTMNQVSLFEKLVEKYGLEFKTAFHMYVPASLSLKRRTIKKRGSWEDPLDRERFFQENTVPVLLHFKRKAVLKTLYGAESVKSSAKKITNVYKKNNRLKRLRGIRKLR